MRLDLGYFVKRGSDEPKKNGPIYQMIHSFKDRFFKDRFFEVVFSIEGNLIRLDNAAQDSNFIHKNINFWEGF